MEIRKNKLGEEGRQFHSSPPGAKLPSYATAWSREKRMPVRLSIVAIFKRFITGWSIRTFRLIQIVAQKLNQKALLILSKVAIIIQATEKWTRNLSHFRNAQAVSSQSARDTATSHLIMWKPRSPFLTFFSLVASHWLFLLLTFLRHIRQVYLTNAFS